MVEYIKDIDGDYSVLVRGIANDIHPSAKFGKGVILSGWIRIGEDVEIGEGTRIGNYCCIDNGSKVGKNTNFQNGVHLTNNTIVGNKVFIGAYVVFADEKYPACGEQIRYRCVVGNNVVIGTRAVIVACDIQDDSVLGALSMLMQTLPKGEVWAGGDWGVVARKVAMADSYYRKKEQWEDAVLHNW